MMMPDNGQNSNAGSDQDPGNMTAPNSPPDRNFGNMTDNMTMPGPGNTNMTAYGNMTWHGHDRMTAGNMTFCYPPRDGNTTATGNWTAPDNMTLCQLCGENSTIPGGNMTVPKPADGNVTPPQAPSDNGTTNWPQNQKDSDLIATFLKWLNGQTST
jgi:hypothetical protein